MHWLQSCCIKEHSDRPLRQALQLLQLHYQSLSMANQPHEWGPTKDADSEVKEIALKVSRCLKIIIHAITLIIIIIIIEY